MNEWLEKSFGFLLADPWMLLFILLIPPALWWRSRRREPAALVGNGAMFASLPGTWRVTFAPLPRILQIGSILCAIFALARPVVRERVPLKTEGIDILLCIDLSSSMQATDMDENGQLSRLDLVKAKARNFVEARVNDRIGLLTFAAFPELRCPLTLDHDALLRFIRDTELVKRGSEFDRTGIGLALARGSQIMKNSESRSRVVVLLTDGQENVREIEPVEAARLAKQFNIRVYTIGAGRGDETFFGMQPIDFGELKEVAREADGKFFLARDAGALDETYKAIDALEKVQLSDPRYRYEEKFQWIFAPGIACFALALALRWTLFAATP
ncbi:MAG: VWA domain-containing protein [Planctomycetes bacterium]|nr:VWA domain-containing protein [Planctomycetota bacterium]